MQSATQSLPNYQLPHRTTPGPVGRVVGWLDERGKLAWIGAMVVGFVAFWPVGLGILGYMIWSKRMFGCSKRSYKADYRATSTGNSAFDAYRAETLKRLEDEHSEFMAFLEKLREAKDKSEFDQFMQQRDSKAEQ